MIISGWKPKLLAMCAVFMAATILSVINPSRALAFSGSGAGTVGDPFQVTTCVQLQEMGDDLDAHYRLLNNIDCSATTGWNAGAGFVPVGDDTTPFTGTLDGNDKVVSGLFINRPTTDYVGLIGYADTITVQDLGLENVDITGQSNVGGLIGNWVTDGTATNIHSTGSVTSIQAYAGGLVGFFGTGVSIADSHSTAAVTGDERPGGLVGQNFGTITRSYATGDVEGGFLVGGLVGDNWGSIDESYATGDVTNTADDSAGGLAAENYGTITDSYATGNVSGFDWIGGLVGYSEGDIVRSYATGNATGDVYVAGLVGQFSGSENVTDSYALGSANGTQYVGGLIGDSDTATISNSYSVGAVTGTTDVGGLLGAQSGTIDDSFWNTQTSGQATSAGGTGKTTAQMKTLATFDDASWNITTTTTNRNNGYPFLSWETGGSSPVWLIYVASAADGDGVSNTVEDAAPNSGDGNNDGTADSQQAHVVSFVDTVTGKYATLEVNSACTLTAAGSGAESAQTTVDSNFDYPAGLLNFTATCGTPGFTTGVTQYYYGVANNGFVLRKYNPTTQAYSTVSGTTLAQVTVGGQTVTKATYQVSDGSSLDTDGTANGTIVDPVGLALAANSAGELADTGRSVLFLYLLAFGLFGGSAWTLVKQSRYPRTPA
jgi:hypothetical protein